MQFTDFAHMAFNQVTNEIAKFRYRTDGDWGAPLVIRAPMGGHSHGALYHSQSIEAMFCHIPGLKVVVPSTPYDAKGLLRAAIRDPDPVLYFEHKRAYRLVKGEVPDEEYTVPLGQAATVREGDDIAIFSYGLMTRFCVEAADAIAADGFDCAVVDLRTLRPLDREAIVGAARRCGKVLVVQEANLAVSVASEVAAIVAEECFEHLDAPVMRLGGPEIPAVPFSPPLEEFYMLNPAKIEARLRELAAY
jgi:2-oxoisovalerate dehydrogenase E1 component beta subunit